MEAFITEIGTSLCGLDVVESYNVENAEKGILKALYHPFGVKYGLKCIKARGWIEQAIENVKIPKYNTVARSNKVVRSKNCREYDDLESFVACYEKYVCEIRTNFGRGTGTLISGDGLILTCAHVLMGQNVNVSFNNQKKPGKYDCDILFVDEINDVALIKAKNFKSTAWANIRLNGSSIKGEDLVAIGNPAINNELKNAYGATVGVISNPEIKTRNTVRMVNDITIASGSSGGPLFSRKTGDIVGVVTHVGSAGFSKNVASSGFLCLAAPSQRLPKWLGLTY